MITHPQDRDPNASSQSRRIVDLNALQLWRTGNWVLLASEPGEGLPEVDGRLGVLEGDLVDRRQVTGASGLDISDDEINPL